MPKNGLVRKIVKEGELRIDDLRKQLGVHHNTVSRWITDGRLRESDQRRIKLEAIKGTDGGWRTSQGCYVRFLEALNARPR